MYAHQRRRRRGRSTPTDRDTENDDMHCVFLAQNGSLQFADYHSTIVCPLSTSRDAAAGVDRLMGDSGASMKLEGFPCRAQTLVMDWLVATPSWRVEEGQSRPAQPPFKSHILLRSSNGNSRRYALRAQDGTRRSIGQSQTDRLASTVFAYRTPGNHMQDTA